MFEKEAHNLPALVAGVRGRDHVFEIRVNLKSGHPEIR